MYQCDSLYDQEVPHMYPQVKDCLALRTSNAVESTHFDIKFILSRFHYVTHIPIAGLAAPQREYADKVKTFQLTHKVIPSSSPSLWYSLLVCDVLWREGNFLNKERCFIIFFFLLELFQDLCQMQEHWMIEGIKSNVWFYVKFAVTRR